MPVPMPPPPAPRWSLLLPKYTVLKMYHLDHFSGSLGTFIASAASLDDLIISPNTSPVPIAQLRLHCTESAEYDQLPHDRKITPAVPTLANRLISLSRTCLGFIHVTADENFLLFQGRIIRVAACVGPLCCYTCKCTSFEILLSVLSDV